MFTEIFSSKSSVGNSISDKNLLATPTSASLGQAWNQSIEVALIRPGNLRALILKLSPTGEKHNMSLNFYFMEFMKYSLNAS